MKNKIEDYVKNEQLDIEKIVDEYSGYVYKVIENMTRSISDEDIEEIISDTFFVLWKNRNKLEKEKLLSSYIAGITRNLVREKTRIVNMNYDISNYENSIIDIERVDMLCEERERIAIIQKFIRKMKEEDIKIFEYYYYSSMKIKEIAVIMNVPEFKVKSRLHRIRKKIKIEMEKGGYSYEE